MHDQPLHCQVDLEPVGCRVDCDLGDSLLEAARAAGLTLTSVCGGDGTCGQCLVRVVRGAVSDLTATERDALDAQQITEGYRLACQARLRGDVTLDIPLASRTVTQRLELAGVDVDVPFEPAVAEHLAALTPPTVQDPHSDLTLLCSALSGRTGTPVESMDPTALRRLPGLLRSHGWRVRASLQGSEIVDVRPPDQHPLGLAVDIGTTKLAAYLVDMQTGAALAVDGITNPQIAYGEDVMSRVSFAMKGDAGRLTAALLDGLNELLRRMCPHPERIVEAVVVGNTAMHHLFLGLPVRSVGLAPYTAVASDPLDVKARDVGLAIAPGAYVHMLPNVAGFIGADHVAMILATGLDRTPGTYLGLDIGTNTEVVLACGGRLRSCSTASGPAFDGAHIKHGVRAVDGAIEQVRLEGDGAQVRTVNGVPPIGICGSGVLDAIDQLRRAGLLTRRGRLLPHPRVQDVDGQREFVLVTADQSGTCRDITLGEHDIGEVMLAKAAIRTGIDVLCTKKALHRTHWTGSSSPGRLARTSTCKARSGSGCCRRCL
jgi:uncharacterized 2Fe-2S/4Fe-4S cluster protein (DUF4445 family)